MRLGLFCTYENPKNDYRSAVCVEPLLASPDSTGDVFNRKLAVGLCVGLKIFHADNYLLSIRLLCGVCDDAPGKPSDNSQKATG